MYTAKIESERETDPGHGKRNSDGASLVSIPW